MKNLWRIWLAMAAVAALAATDGGRGITVAPVAATAPGGNAALFVGVNRFVEDESLQPLTFAVNDAIAQAHLFVIELKLIPPANSFLALSGEPTTDSAKAQLASLTQAGTQRVPATKTRVLLTLQTVATLPGTEANMLVVSLSSHGFEESNHAYVMPSDGARSSLRDTALSLNTIEQKLAGSKAGKRLLLVDACREKASKETRGGDAVMSAAFRDALAAAEGQAMLASCDAGQLSLENPNLGHGVFTYFLLEAFRGKAMPDARGFVTLGSVSDYLGKAVPEWIQRNRPDANRSAVQKPWFKGPVDAKQIPLAVDPGIQTRLNAFKAGVTQTVEALKLKIDRKGPFTTALYDRLAAALDQIDPEDDADKELVSASADFAAGKIQAAVFVRYLESALTIPKERELRKLRRAADNGDPSAMFKLAMKHRTTELGEANLEASRNLLEKAAQGGSTKAMHELAYMYYNGSHGVTRDKHLALKWWRQEAAMGAPRGLLSLGRAYKFGYGVSKDETEALAYFKKACAAAQGHDESDAALALGICYDDGWGVGKDATEAAKWYRKAAELGDAYGMVLLGTRFVSGTGITKDAAEGVKWFRKAVELGEADGMSGLGWCYEAGWGVGKDATEALKWYRKAADWGNPHALMNVGRCYMNGTGVAKDEVEAVKWYRKAADSDYATAIYLLGWCFGSGKGVVKDEIEAVKYYRKAVELGESGSMFQLGGCYERGAGVAKDAEEALKWYRKAAELGNVDAISSVGTCYGLGIGVAKDEAEAVKWFRKAVELENPHAMYNLGACYERGIGVTKDEVEAVKWYRKASELGDPSAMSNLGVCYRLGRGITKDEIEALKWQQKAAELGNPRAMAALGEHLVNGIGIPKDDNEALKWCQKSADLGDAAGMTWVGFFYESGRAVPKDVQAAIKWYRKAAALGDDFAKQRLKALNVE